MKILNQDNNSTTATIWGDTFQKGKIRIDWSQSRGGFATFVSGRLEGVLHDSREEARLWLALVGVNESRIPQD